MDRSINVWNDVTQFELHWVNRYAFIPFQSVHHAERDKIIEIRRDYNNRYPPW